MNDNALLQEIGQGIKASLYELRLVNDAEGLEEWRVKYLGRKGMVLDFTRQISTLALSLKPEAGKKINQWKCLLLSSYDAKKNELVSGTVRQSPDKDYTYPGVKPDYSYLHPLTLVTRNVVDIFRAMGFGVHVGPEIETDYYNFEALNTPQYHPARDMWDTFYLDREEGILLRTHTSPVQIRVMEKLKPPFRIVALGKCFRRDAFDASHSPVFHQMEGLMVGEGINFAHLKGTLIYFLRELFGTGINVRFLPAYFPFTEPSAEIGISCVICNGRGCPTCGGSGWLEILGAGMVHPEVFTNMAEKKKNVCYSPEKITGFAFGMGIERIAMLKYGIDDIRHFYNNDVRFIKQF